MSDASITPIDTAPESGEAMSVATLQLSHSHSGDPCSGSPHCDGASFRECSVITPDSCYCFHWTSASRADAVLEELRRILQSFADHPRDAGGVAHVGHHHAGACGAVPHACDADSRLSCHPAPDGASCFCLHTLNYPLDAAGEAVIQSILASPLPGS